MCSQSTHNITHNTLNSDELFQVLVILLLNAADNIGIPYSVFKISHFNSVKLIFFFFLNTKSMEAVYQVCVSEEDMNQPGLPPSRTEVSKLTL